MDFASINPPSSPNFYLLCPPHYCSAPASQPSPLYSVSVEKLEKSWMTMVAKQPRTRLLYANPAEHEYEYQQRSLVFRFPDIIQVKFMALTDHTSTLVIYSHAKYGYYDFGVNKKRALGWLGAMGLNDTVIPN